MMLVIVRVDAVIKRFFLVSELERIWSLFQGTSSMISLRARPRPETWHLRLQGSFGSSWFNPPVHTLVKNWDPQNGFLSLRLRLRVWRPWSLRGTCCSSSPTMRSVGSWWSARQWSPAEPLADVGVAGCVVLRCLNIFFKNKVQSFAIASVVLIPMFVCFGAMAFKGGCTHWLQNHPKSSSKWTNILHRTNWESYETNANNSTDVRQCICCFLTPLGL